MALILASTFTDSLGKLSHAEQKQAKLAAFDLQLDLTGNGLQMHRIDATPGFWSARVSGDIRLILHKDRDETTLIWVDHHDAAYRWAERRRMVTHERTGAMQIVEIVETTEVAAVPVQAGSDGTVREEKIQPFWALDDDQLLEIGVPRDWLDPVRAMDVDEVDTLFDRLPAEAAEALYDYATGGKLEDHIAAPAAPGTSPYAYHDAQRRFRLLDNVEELQAALDAPFEKWAVFLHPAQRALVERPVTGPIRVTGSAGTGKTIVALHRAVHVARSDPDAEVLLTTFSQPLADALSRKHAILTASDADTARRITVQPLDQAAVDLYTSWFGQPTLASRAQIRAIVNEAVEQGLGGGLSPEFLFEEWEELVDAWGVVDPDVYAKLPRVGRRTRLGPQQREAAWRVFEHVRTAVAVQGLTTMATVYAALEAAAKDGRRLPCTHVVVDEAQDLTVAQVRFLAAIGGVGARAPFLAGDIGQRIFRLPFSWAKLGLDIRGRSHSLKVNYRTSHQIRAMADRLLPPSITDMDGVEEGRRGVVSTFDGPQPDINIAADETEECRTVADWLRSAVTDGITPSEVALLVRSDAQRDRAQRAINASNVSDADGSAPAIVTMHEAKGLEFRAVAVIACDEDVLPDPARLAAIGDIAELEAAYETERQLLYVATTRARDRLLVTGVSPGSEFLDDLR